MTRVRLLGLQPVRFSLPLAYHVDMASLVIAELRNLTTMNDRSRLTLRLREPNANNVAAKIKELAELSDVDDGDILEAAEEALVDLAHIVATAVETAIPERLSLTNEGWQICTETRSSRSVSPGKKSSP